MRTTSLAAAALATGLFLGGCACQPDRDQIEKDCIGALAARPDGDRSKPKVCEQLPQEDYELLQ